MSAATTSPGTAAPTAITVIGAGLAGCEAAALLARAGLAVRLIDLKPDGRTPAHRSPLPAELVCSNSLRSERLSNAVGLLKAELRQAGALLLAAADATRVPAGRALAVDRQAFSAWVDERLAALPLVTRVCAEVTRLPPAADGQAILATGPLTTPALLADLALATGRAHLSFYDALAPIVAGDSIDRTRCFYSSRYDGGDDYLNCPLTEAEYGALQAALAEAELTPLREFEEPRFFEACLPVEELARRSPQALAFGPLKPVGLPDPRTGQTPFAVVQLRREDASEQAFNLVGFQTRIRQSLQPEVLRLIPALARARFLRLGAMHRNAFVDAPVVLDRGMALRVRPWLRIAGQLAGVEGYLESIAHGFLTALHALAAARGQVLAPPPPECALGALQRHVGGLARSGWQYEPHNIHWGLFPAPARRTRGKRERSEVRGEIGLAAFGAWWRQTVEQLALSAVDAHRS